MSDLSVPSEIFLSADLCWEPPSSANGRLVLGLFNRDAPQVDQQRKQREEQVASKAQGRVLRKWFRFWVARLLVIGDPPKKKRGVVFLVETSFLTHPKKKKRNTKYPINPVVPDGVPGGNPLFKPIQKNGYPIRPGPTLRR